MELKIGSTAAGAVVRLQVDTRPTTGRVVHHDAHGLEGIRVVFCIGVIMFHGMMLWAMFVPPDQVQQVRVRGGTECYCRTMPTRLFKCHTPPPPPPSFVAVDGQAPDFATDLVWQSRPRHVPHAVRILGDAAAATRAPKPPVGPGQNPRPILQVSGSCKAALTLMWILIRNHAVSTCDLSPLEPGSGAGGEWASCCPPTCSPCWQSAGASTTSSLQDPRSA